MAPPLVRGAGVVVVETADQHRQLAFPTARDPVPTRAHTRAYMIPGSGGMLGTALQEVARERGERCAALPQSDLDITDRRAVWQAAENFAGSLPRGMTGAIVNAAAYTDVEGAEDDAETAYAVNEEGARNVAMAAQKHRLRLVHVSTDFVFDGARTGPYHEHDEPNPLGVYGASKLAGEWAVAAACPGALIVRTAWVFGRNGNNFPLKIVSAARERGTVSVVEDEVGSPTYTADLAAATLRLLDADAPAGVYHLVGDGQTTRYDLALEVLRLADLDVPVLRARSADFKTKAKRPANSVLDCSKAAAFGVTLPDWRDALARFLADATAEVR